jgi:putative oxidoreductase
MNKLFQLPPLHNDFSALLLRLIVGGLFIYHGQMKIVNYDTYLAMTSDIIGIGATLTYNLVIFAEFFCGILVMIGWFTRLTILPIAITMAVAYFIAHKKDPFLMKELPFVFLCLSLLVFVMGSGRFSVDGLLQKRKPPR